MAQEKTSLDAADALYGFIWDSTILEFLINLHFKRNELSKLQQAVSKYVYLFYRSVVGW